MTSFLLYAEQLEQIQLLDMQQRGLLLTALMEAASGIMPEQGAMDPVVYVAFSFIWAQVLRDKKKFAETSAARSAAGAAGAAGRWQRMANDGKGKQGMAKRGKAKQAVANDDNASQSMANDGNALEAVASDGNASQTMANDGKQWQTMANDGNASQTCQNENENENENDNNIKRESKKRKPAGPAAATLLPSLDEAEAERLDAAFRSFAEMRKKIRAPLTDDAARLVVNNLQKLATVADRFDADLAVKILNQSTEKAWRGVFPLKDNTALASAPAPAAEKKNAFHNFEERTYNYDQLMAENRRREALNREVPCG